MSERFQFSLGRLLACISMIAFAATDFGNVFSVTRQSKSSIPIVIGWIAALLMAGAGIGFLISSRVVVACLCAAATFALLALLGFVLTR